MKILIVDDQPQNVLLLESLLGKKYDCSVAYNGFDAINQVQKNAIDLVLLDVLMPQIDGFEVLRKIKANSVTKNTKVIMVTCKTEIEDIKLALEEGASDYIKKPVDSTELFTKIEIQNKLISHQKQLNEYQVYANIHDTMILAKHLQFSLLPDKDTMARLFKDQFVINLPRDIVSGDSYFASRQGEKTFFTLFDSAHHGVPAAMLSIMTYMLLHEIVNKNHLTSPDRVAFLLHQELKAHLYHSQDIYNQIGSLDAIFFEYNAQNSILSMVSAKRPLILVRNNPTELLVNETIYKPVFSENGKSVYILNGTKNEISIDDEVHEFTPNAVEILPNDTAYLFTDGYIDQIGGFRNRRFTRKQFLSNLIDFQNMSMTAQKIELYNLFADWSIHHEQTDDILLIGLKF